MWTLTVESAGNVYLETNISLNPIKLKIIIGKQKIIVKNIFIFKLLKIIFNKKTINAIQIILNINVV